MFAKAATEGTRFPEPEDSIRQPLLDILLRTYPSLSKMTLNLLSIPSMSAAPKRLFSSRKITLTDCRKKLSVRVIEALECLQS
jgi:hypothetical protein